jgi:Fe-S cluster assembly protein SufB
VLDQIYYYVRPQDRMKNNWEDVPDNIKNTFDKLGIPEAEQKILAGVGAQYESEMVYHSLKKEWEAKGVIFDSIEDGLKKHPELFRKHFATVVPPADNKFAALNSAVWSGGSFVYIPKGVHLDTPLQAYFRVNQERMGQFERTLIICDEESRAHYIEGCTAPVYSTESFHSGVIEIVVAKGAHFRYTTIQNWSHNMYNLVTQRALVHEGATMEWLDGNLGSKATMKYPSCYLVGEGAHGSILSIAYAGDGQHQDTGGKVVHVAPRTTSTIMSKSISKGTGRASYRGLCKVYEGAKSARSNVECDALLLNETARTDTYPYIEIEERSANVGHEASVSKIGEEQLFYLMSRGMSGDEATAMIVRGFIEPIAKELPLEYAVELNRLIELEMEGSVG